MRALTAGVVLVLVVASWPLPAQQQSLPDSGAPGAAAAPAQDGGRGRAGGGPARGGRGGPGGGGRGDMSEPDFSPKPPVVPLTPAEQTKTFWLPEGFRMQAVLSEPHTEEPGQIAFDGNGRMFVVELRGYMQDVEATGQFDPVGRITVHEDKDNDGIYETHGVFVDKLVFPRWVMPLGKNSVLTMESNADEVWKFTDKNNDGVAETKEFFASGFGRLTNVELAQSGLTWALDNWMYSTVNQHRARWTPNGVIKEPTSYNNGQWGLTQDNYGTIYFQGGGSGLPTYFQFPPVYGYVENPDRFEPNLNITWGAPVLVADMVGGMGSVRMPDGSNVRTTAGAGNDVFRGDRLPPDLVGDYFYGEPVSRIVRRLRPVKHEGLTQLRNFYPLSEFIRSVDPLFRPVDMSTAPDGTMYITDMYRGIVQEREWNRPGSYLRQRIAQYQLDKVIRHGRIWRLSHVNHPRDTRRPRMLEETPKQLLAHLGHPNGWWRDTAQQLLVLAQDKSVVPQLKEMAGTSRNQLERIHALWTLEGLGAADANLVRTLMKAADPQIRIQAIRVSESLYKAGDRSFAGDYKAMAADADVNVAIQALLTHNILKAPGTSELAEQTMAARPAAGIRLVAEHILKPAASVAGGRGGMRPDGLPVPFTTDEQSVMERGERAYTEVCAACHGLSGQGEPVVGGAAGATRAPSLAASMRVQGHRDYVIKALLHGVSGPVDGKTYDDVMIPMSASPDQWIADVGSYIRNAFGTRGTFVSPDDVGRVRRATEARKTLWTTSELEASVPRLVLRDPGWKVTASHRSDAAMGALGFEPWESGEPMAAGMWLQVEFSQSLRLTEIQFESAPLRQRSPDSGSGTTSVSYGGPLPPPESVGYPRGYEITVSTDGVTWSQPVARGTANGPKTTATFAPVSARFLRLTQTATVENAPQLSILQLRFYELR